MANLKLSAITASGTSLASGDGIVGYQTATTSDRLFTAAQLGAGIGPAGLGAATATSLAVGGATLGTSILVVPAGSAAAPSLAIGNSTTGLYSVSTTGFGFSINGVTKADFGIFQAASWSFTGSSFNFINGNVILNNVLNTFQWSTDLALSRKAAANLQLGQADAATSVAQTISFQGIVAGTSNTSGSTATLVGSLSTGSGTSGDLVLKTGGTGAGATAQNTATTALTVKGVTQRVIAATTIATGGYTVAGLPAGVIGDRAYVTDALTPTFLGILTGGSSTVTPVFYNGSAWVAN